jgi:MerR family transcriptional regulator, light-induced transcriptional regulator
MQAGRDDLPITEVARRTGVASATLRAWESRYGFPVPRRLPGGHRRYSEADCEAVAEVVRARQEGLSLEAAIERVTRPGRQVDQSVCGALHRADPGLPAFLYPQSVLLAMSRALEDEYLSRGEPATIFGGFQTESAYDISRRRWSELARTAASAVVFADFARPALRRRPVQIPLDPEAVLRREWAVVIDGPSFAACLAGWEEPEVIAGEARRFEMTWTLEPRLVRSATHACIDLVRPVAPELAASIEAAVSGMPAPAPPEVRAATLVTNRMTSRLVSMLQRTADGTSA